MGWQLIAAKIHFRGLLGVTLVDVLVGVFVFGITFIAAMSGLRYSSALNSSQDEISTVNAILQEIGEDLWSKPYASITVGTGLSASYSNGGADEPMLLDNLPGGSVTVTVTEPEGASTGLKRIWITVSWNASFGPAQPQSMKLYRAEY